MIRRISDHKLTGVILAGGVARRMGERDKSLLLLDNRRILDHVVERARPQVGRLLVNTNSDAMLFSDYDLPVIKDTVPGYPGPLAGVLSAMEWLNASSPSPSPSGGDRLWLASFAADSPFFPANLVGELHAAAIENDADIACASHGGRHSPLFALWATDLEQDLRRYLEEGQRRVQAFQQRHRCVSVRFESEAQDPFFNINTPDDLDEARALMRARSAATR